MIINIIKDFISLNEILKKQLIVNKSINFVLFIFMKTDDRYENIRFSRYISYISRFGMKIIQINF